MRCVKEEGSLMKSYDYQLWLCSIPDLYWQKRMALLRYFGTAKELWEAPEEEFDTWKNTGITWIHKVISRRSECFLEQVKRTMEQKHIAFVPDDDLSFPQRLKKIPDCPHGIFYKGTLPPEDTVSVAIVGARSCSNYGNVIASELAHVLAEQNIPVISGMALGIDGIAQKAALEAGGRSYGVLGCGADICYPKEHIQLYLDLPQHGAVLSEFACQVPPLKPNFPARNRIISGLADIVVVVEAREKSGSLITAGTALSQGKEVYAVPGRCSDPRSMGCNRLISDGAYLYLTPEDLMERAKEMAVNHNLKAGSASGHNKNTGINAGHRSGTDGGARKKSPGKPESGRKEYASSTARVILQTMDLEPLTLNDLLLKTSLSSADAAEGLLELQFSGAVKEVARNVYVRTSSVP